jgi:hypothetical protein
MFHSIQKPWFRRKIATNASSTLAKIIPVQHLLQAFNLNYRSTNQYRVPLAWGTCRCMQHNAQQLANLAKAPRLENGGEALEIRSRAWSSRCWTGVAMAERLLQYPLPHIPSAYGAHAIVVYQTLCVLSRTYCETANPDLIEQFTKLV